MTLFFSYVFRKPYSTARSQALKESLRKRKKR